MLYIVFLSLYPPLALPFPPDPNSGYTPAQYGYIKRMNLLSNTWDVPSANFLGAIEDGQGHWVDGYHANGGHPNGAGSTEMYLLVGYVWGFVDFAN